MLAGFVFTINPSLLFWIGSAIAVVLLLLLLFWNPVRNKETVARFENEMVRERENSKPGSRDFLNVFKVRSLWEIAIFLVFSGTFYTIFDQHMFPQFFKTQAMGDHMYGILN